MLRTRALVRQMAEARGRRRASENDDVLDPIGRPVEVHQEVGDTSAHASSRCSRPSWCSTGTRAQRT
ncbi:hypothetical protein FHR93_005144 [Geodermatophilus sabuli]|uniref:Uncharacterized protein n=1 Tax=Geodermatophilus sabuli TaxID=1564158 RepID=A0A285EL66_9ACTN|nr:hypothetical protein [Geodermatophilus sabuli]SNX98721.1 hypothetical protein SAMN06893097_11216 [Geodermatophilus sabuli]